MYAYGHAVWFLFYKYWVVSNNVTVRFPELFRSIVWFYGNYVNNHFFSWKKSNSSARFFVNKNRTFFNVFPVGNFSEKYIHMLHWQYSPVRMSGRMKHELHVRSNILFQLKMHTFQRRYKFILFLFRSENVKGNFHYGEHKKRSQFASDFFPIFKNEINSSMKYSHAYIYTCFRVTFCIMETVSSSAISVRILQ